MRGQWGIVACVIGIVKLAFEVWMWHCLLGGMKRGCTVGYNWEDAGLVHAAAERWLWSHGGSQGASSDVLTDARGNHCAAEASNCNLFREIPGQVDFEIMSSWKDTPISGLSNSS